MGKKKIEPPKYIDRWHKKMLGIKERDLQKKGKEKSEFIKKQAESIWLFLRKGKPSIVATVVTIESLRRSEDLKNWTSICIKQNTLFFNGD